MPTPIVIKAGDTIIPATLNDTAAAFDFKKRLPITVTGRKSDMDFCCNAACGVFDPTQTQSGWKNGDISLAAGWLAILFAGEEISSSYRGMMIIGHIETKDLQRVKDLPSTVKFTIELV